MTPADIAEARAAVSPLSPAGLLIAFPSLDFPGRDSLKVTELAPRLRISWGHLVDLLYEDGVARLDLTFGHVISRPTFDKDGHPDEPHTPKKPKAALRIPLSAWRQWIPSPTHHRPTGSRGKSHRRRKRPQDHQNHHPPTRP